MSNDPGETHLRGAKRVLQHLTLPSEGQYGSGSKLCVEDRQHYLCHATNPAIDTHLLASPRIRASTVWLLHIFRELSKLHLPLKYLPPLAKASSQDKFIYS
jgi:hypothetical protein